MGKLKSKIKKAKAGGGSAATPPPPPPPKLAYPWTLAATLRSASGGGKGPSGRMGAAVLAAAPGQGCDGWVVGGYNEDGCSEEVWRFSLRHDDPEAPSVTWAQARPARAPGPFPRAMCRSASLIGANGTDVYVFGGMDERGPLADLWRISFLRNETKGPKWRCVDAPLAPAQEEDRRSVAAAPVALATPLAAAEESEALPRAPPARCNFAMASVQGGGGGLVLVQGGESDGDLPHRDLWVLDARSATDAGVGAGAGASAATPRPCWADASAIAGKGPSPRCSHEAVALAHGRAVIFFGGVGLPATKVPDAGSGASVGGGEVASGGGGSGGDSGDGALETAMASLSVGPADGASGDEDDWEDADGEDPLMPLNDVWVLHLGDGAVVSGGDSAAFGSAAYLARWRWSALAATSGLAPSPRSLAALAAASFPGSGDGGGEDVVFVFGGYGLYEESGVGSGDEPSEEAPVRIGYLGDLWALDVASGAWACAGDLKAPPAHLVAGDGAADRASGGAAGAVEADEPRAPLGPRNGHGLCVLGDRLCAFGGYNGAVFLDEVVVAPTDWQRAGVPVAPPADDDDEGDDEGNEEGNYEGNDDGDEEAAGGEEEEATADGEHARNDGFERIDLVDRLHCGVEEGLTCLCCRPQLPRTARTTP